MIKIVGTDHFMSKEAIEGIIKDENPDIIAVELCGTRFEQFTGHKLPKQSKDNSLIGEISDTIKRKAEEEGLDYGSDQKTAMFYAIDNEIHLMMVDKDINEIRESMSKIPQEEMIYLQNELLKFQQESVKQEVNENEVIRKMKSDIPTAYKILVEERDNHIIKELKEAREKYPNKRILAFLGKGHAKTVEDALK